MAVIKVHCLGIFFLILKMKPTWLYYNLSALKLLTVLMKKLIPFVMKLDLNSEGGWEGNAFKDTGPFELYFF